MYRVVVLTLSDSGYAGLREDGSGACIKALMEGAGYGVVDHQILPDTQALIEARLQEICDNNRADLILTTGGTGFSPRDCTPEATIAVCEKMAPGIGEAMRWRSLQITERAMLSRAVAGIRKQTLIVNLPGSTKAVQECLSFILPTLEHGLDILTENQKQCGG